MIDSTLEQLYFNLQRVGINAEKKTPKNGEDSYVRVVLHTPHQVLEMNIHGQERDRSVEISALSYEIDCEPRNDPNRVIRACGDEFWIALHHISRYAHQPVAGAVIESQAIPRPGRRIKEWERPHAAQTG